MGGAFFVSVYPSLHFILRFAGPGVGQLILEGRADAAPFIFRVAGPEVGQQILEGGADAAPEAIVKVQFLFWRVGSVIWLYVEVHGGNFGGNVNVVSISGTRGKHEVIEVPPMSLDVGLG